MLSFDAARSQLLCAGSLLSAVEEIPLAQAVGRVLAVDVVSASPVPPFDNSAMDGVAFSIDAVVPNTQGGCELPLSQTVFAGSQSVALELGTAARIFTGAMLPQGADTVVLQENCDIREASVIVPTDCVAGQYIRRRGEDIQQGQLLLSRGQRLKASDIGLLASVGVAKLQAYVPLRIALISSGDELRNAGEALVLGQIYNSCGPMLTALLQQAGFVVESFCLADDLDASCELLQHCAQSFDVLVSIGGVSVGDKDFIKQALERVGQLHLWKVAMKPGKPFSFGQIAAVPLLGLPGNPVSAFASLQLFGLDFLLQAQGCVPCEKPLQFYPIILEQELQPQREEFLRVSLLQRDGVWLLQPYRQQGSGVLSSVAQCTGFARISNQRLTRSMDAVAYWPFRADSLI
jgi:molybdopterin molybdotransferase